MKERRDNMGVIVVRRWVVEEAVEKGTGIMTLFLQRVSRYTAQYVLYRSSCSRVYLMDNVRKKIVGCVHWTDCYAHERVSTKNSDPE